MAIGSDIVSSITGNVESALLILEDRREIGDSSADALKVKTSNALANGLKDVGAGALGTSGRKTFRVQFNPSELQLDALVDTVERVGVQNSAEEGQRRSAASASTTASQIDLSLNLIFDQVNVYDSFMWDKATNLLSVNGVAGAVAAAAGKVYTVQPEVEGLIGALRDPFTRTITFQWADFSFTGTLESVSAKYTMFSVSGRPVRANVFLRLQMEQGAEEIAAWSADFDAMFGADGKASLVTADQKAGSLVNLGLSL